MRNAVGEIDGPVNRIYDPALLGFHVTQHASFAENRDVRVSRPQRLFDQFLTAHVQFELDVVLRCRVDSFGRPKVAPHQFTGGLRRLHGNT